jgi:hypothetical protein
MRFNTSLAYAALALSLAAFTTVGAHADVIHVTYTGTLTNSRDDTNVFGLGTGNLVLNDQSVMVEFAFDASLGVLSTGTTPPLSRLDGGGSATVTVNHHSVTILTIATAAYPPTALSLLLNQDNGFPNRYTHSHVGNPEAYFDPGTFVSEFADVQVFDNTGTIPVSILEPYTLSIPAGNFGSFHFEDHQPFQVPPDESFSHADFAEGTFALETVAVRVEAPVATPLPATLPLFGTGLGVMAFLGWRRKA